MSGTPIRSPKCSDKEDEADIREVLEDVTQQVEHLTCSKLMDVGSSVISPGVSPCKNTESNKLNPVIETSVDRSKHRSGNRKSRVRHRKHKWKPYHKLTSNERRRLEERISRRAYRSREKMSASGLALAPYNTTQFLMDDHNDRQPDYDFIPHESKNKEDYNSSEDFYSSPDDDDDEFMQQQFSKTYETCHDDFINNMSKSDLIRELIRLEDEIEAMERTLKAICEEKSELDVEAEMEKIQVFQVEIKKLTQENRFLEQQNEELRQQLSKINAVL